MKYGGYTHVHISERETAHMSPCGWDDAAWEDCRPTSTVEMLRAAGHPEIPATHEEAEELRCDSGRAPTGGTNSGDMQRAAAKRYRIAIPNDTQPQMIWSRLVPGTVASVGGNMGVFPDGSRWRRWDASFKGLHQVCVFRLDATDRVWWCDPLAPTKYRSGTQILTYDGEWMPKADFLRFATLGAAIMPIATAQEEPMPTAQVNERWHPTVTNGQSNGVLRASMDRAAPIVRRVPANEYIVTIAEYGSGAASWRLVETADRTVLFALRSDWISDGPPVVDTTASYNAGVDAASKAAATARK